MEEIGVVTSIDGRHAHVKVQRSSMCEKCQGGVCTMADDGMDIEAVNSAAATIGQRVMVMMPSGYIKGSLIAYGIPIAALFAGAVLGKQYLSPLFPAKDPELMSAFGGFGALALSVIALKIWTSLFHSERPADDRMPVITQILEDYKIPGEGI